MPELPGRGSYRFGRFRLDPNGRVLFRGDRAVRLPPKAADTLLLLIQNAGNVVEKQDLLKHVWQDAFVEEGSLTRTISILRKALEDATHGQRFISTIAKRGYRFAAPVIEIPGEATRSTTERLMIVVLPFENLSGGKKHDYFSEGLTEDMITRLARLNPDRLGVIARTSAMQYKSTDKSVRQIGRELGVSHLLEGSVRRAGNRVRIAIQLVQVSDEPHLWAESYERNLGDLLTLQFEVAEAVAREIQIKLAPPEQERLASAATVNPQAYEAYLKGRYLLNRRTLEALQKSLRYFEKSIEHDPHCAAAFCRAGRGWLRTRGSTLRLERTAASRPAEGVETMNRSTYPLKLPTSVQSAAGRLAKANGVSLNQFIAVAVAQKVGVMETEEAFPRRRAGSAQPRDLLKFLRKAGREQPVETDRR